MQRQMRYASRVLVLLACLGNQPLIAQIVNIESQRMQTDSIRFTIATEFNYNYQKNSDREFSLFNSSLFTQLKSKNYKDLWMLILNGEYAATGAVKLSHSFLAHIRYNHKLSEKWRLEAFLQNQNNIVLGIRYRHLFGIGLRYKLTETDQFKCFGGVHYMLESEKELYQKAPSLFNRMSSYCSMVVRLRKHVGEIASIFYYQPTITGWSDFRISNQTSIKFFITTHLTFINSINYMYDAYPPEGINNNSITISNGFRWNF